jgi:hypothetical protein
MQIQLYLPTWPKQDVITHKTRHFSTTRHTALCDVILSHTERDISATSDTALWDVMLSHTERDISATSDTLWLRKSGTKASGPQVCWQIIVGHWRGMYLTPITGEIHKPVHFRGRFLPASWARKVIFCAFQFLCIFETLPDISWYATWQRPKTACPTTFQVCKTRGCLCSFRLLMMDGM